MSTLRPDGQPRPGALPGLPSRGPGSPPGTPGAILVVAVLLQALVAPAGWTAPRGSCTDSDGDGFFVQPSCGPADCNDAAFSVHPGAAEACDGLDNDCNGQIDDAPECARRCAEPDLHPETGEGPPGANPDLVWDGEGYAVVSTREDEVWFARFDAQARPRGEPIRLASGAERAAGASLVSTGDAYGVAWADARTGTFEIYFQGIGASGEPVGSLVRLTDLDGDQEDPSLAWNGSGYGLVWTSTRDLHFLRLDATGQPLGAIVPFTSDLSADITPRLIWAGQSYALTWQLGGLASEIMFSRVSGQGTGIGLPTQVTDHRGLSVLPAVAWTGEGYGLAWYDFRDGSPSIYMALLGPTAQQVGEDIRVTDGGDAVAPVILWTGEEFGLFWRESRDGLDEVHFVRVGAGGEEIGDEMRLPTLGAAGFPTAVWTGTEYGVAWEAGGGVRLGRLGCDCHDADADGASVCRDCDDANPDAQVPGPELCNGVDDDCNGLVDDDGEGEDSDADGLANICDNCPLTPNPLQMDFDADGAGDACETGGRLADTNNSGTVDGFDLAHLAFAFGSSAGESRYHPSLDLNRDGIIDGEDLSLLAGSFGHRG